MKTGFIVSALTVACLSTLAAAQMGPGMDQRGMGSGMMGGQGMGPGTMGGPGMMGGPGAGPGMMGGHGMREGHGMGFGMHGHAAMAALGALKLTDEQRAKMTEIHRDLQRKKYTLMGSARELRWQAEDAAKGAEFDEAAARKRFEAGAALRKQMFEAHLEAHKRIEAVLTPEQREQFRKGMSSGRMGAH